MSSNVTCSILQLDAIFIVQTVISYPLSILAMISQIVCISLIPKVGIFPANVKLLLNSCSFAAFFASINVFLRCFYNTAIIVAGFQSLSQSVQFCLACDGPFSVIMTFFVLSMLAIAIERCYETLRFRANGKNLETEKKLVAKSLIALAAVLAPIWPILNIVSASQNKICYCSMSVVHEKYTIWTGKSTYLSVQSCTILLTWFVWRANRNRLANFNLYTKQYSLQARFRASNNMKTTVMILPYVITHAIFYIIIVALNYIFSRMAQVAESQSMFTVNFQIFLSLISCLDFIVGPFIWMRNHQGLKTLAASKYPFLKKFLMRNTKVKTISGGGLRKVSEEGAGGNLVDFRVEPAVHGMILQQLWTKK